MGINRSSVGRFAKGAVALGVAALVVAGIAAAATLRGGTHTKASASDTFVLANAVKVDTLDPAQNSVNESIWLDQNLYSRLLQPNATGTKLLPDLATSWKVSNGGKTYTFHLRSAKFSDGTPLTAQDAVFSRAVGASCSKRSRASPHPTRRPS
jgi:peptide/nickel transport system substrate-binding protein